MPLMKFKKVVLAYSGGLDTSVIAKWLMEKYECEVITFTADIGQGSETKDAKIKAKKLGIKKIYIEDLQEIFVTYPDLDVGFTMVGHYVKKQDPNHFINVGVVFIGKSSIANSLKLLEFIS